MSEGARIIAERGVSVLLFPEGGRSPEGLREFKEGAAYIAIKAGVPVVPMAIVGMRDLLPMGSLHIRSGRVQFRHRAPHPHRRPQAVRSRAIDSGTVRRNLASARGTRVSAATPPKP